MTLEDFRQLISDIAKIPLSQIKETSSIKDDLGIDSLQLVNLIVLVAERFGMDMTQLNSLEDIRTVEKMYRIFGKGENHE